MSMIAVMLNASPELFAQIQEDYSVLDSFLFDEDSEDGATAAADFEDVEVDMFDLDFENLLVPIFREIAKQAGDNPDDFEVSPAVRSHPLFRAVSATNVLEDYELNYGEAGYHTPDEVVKLAEHLQKFVASIKNEKDVAEEALEEFGELAEFYADAAAQDAYVICGID